MIEYNPKECNTCGFMNDYGACECPPYDKWYACPLEPEPKEEDFVTVKQKRGETYESGITESGTGAV